MMQPLQTILVFTAGVIRTLNRRLHARQRAIDMRILWPACIERAPNLDLALTIFRIHCYQDPAWLELGEATINEMLDRLEVANRSAPHPPQ
jgi:hypothetical protein